MKENKGLIQMRKIYGIGETVYDIIFKNGEPQAARPGGSVLNAMVSLGRTGMPVSFISEYGHDAIGSFIDSFLAGNGVTLNHIDHFRNGRTALAIAVLDDKNDATYTFYKEYPSERLMMEFPPILKNDIVLCGSIYSITREIRRKFFSFIKSSQEKGGIIIYDPNFRIAHLNELDDLRPLIAENMMMASVVRGSDEDFKNIFNAQTPDEAWKTVSEYCGCMVYTASSEAVYVRSRGFSGKFPVKKIEPLSTIGAGDNFNAGMVAAIYRNEITIDELPEMGVKKWEKVISTGIDFASEVCMSYDNYISAVFAARYKNGT